MKGKVNGKCCREVRWGWRWGAGGQPVGLNLPSIPRVFHGRSHFIGFLNKRRSAWIRAALRSFPSWLLRLSENRERARGVKMWQVSGGETRPLSRERREKFWTPFRLCLNGNYPECWTRGISGTCTGVRRVLQSSCIAASTGSVIRLKEVVSLMWPKPDIHQADCIWGG